MKKSVLLAALSVVSSITSVANAQQNPMDWLRICGPTSPAPMPCFYPINSNGGDSPFDRKPISVDTFNGQAYVASASSGFDPSQGQMIFALNIFGTQSQLGNDALPALMVQLEPLADLWNVRGSKVKAHGDKVTVAYLVKQQGNLTWTLKIAQVSVLTGQILFTRSLQTNASTTNTPDSRLFSLAINEAGDRVMLTTSQDYFAADTRMRMYDLQGNEICNEALPFSFNRAKLSGDGKLATFIGETSTVRFVDIDNYIATQNLAASTFSHTFAGQVKDVELATSGANRGTVAVGLDRFDAQHESHAVIATLKRIGMSLVPQSEVQLPDGQFVGSAITKIALAPNGARVAVARQFKDFYGSGPINAGANLSVLGTRGLATLYSRDFLGTGHTVHDVAYARNGKLAYGIHNPQDPATSSPTLVTLDVGGAVAVETFAGQPNQYVDEPYNIELSPDGSYIGMTLVRSIGEAVSGDAVSGGIMP